MRLPVTFDPPLNMPERYKHWFIKEMSEHEDELPGWHNKEI